MIPLPHNSIDYYSYDLAANALTTILLLLLYVSFSVILARHFFNDELIF